MHVIDSAGDLVLDICLHACLLFACGCAAFSAALLFLHIHLYSWQRARAYVCGAAQHRQHASLEQTTF